jgi:glutaredoxin
MITLYGHNNCAIVPVIKILLKRTGIQFNYIDILADHEGKLTLQALHNGGEIVPTIVFADGHTIAEPSTIELRAELKERGYEMVDVKPREMLRVILLGEDWI